MPAFSKGFCQLPPRIMFSPHLQQVETDSASSGTTLQKELNAIYFPLFVVFFFFLVPTEMFESVMVRFLFCFLFFCLPSFTLPKSSELILHLCCLMLLLSLLLLLLLLLLLSPIDRSPAHACWLDPFLITTISSFHRLHSAFPATLCLIVILAANERSVFFFFLSSVE